MNGVLHKPFTLAAMSRMLETHLKEPHRSRIAARMRKSWHRLPRPSWPSPRRQSRRPSRHCPSAALAAPQKAAEDDAPVLDPATTGQLLDMVKIGGGSAVARIYQLYLDNGPPALAEIDAAIASGDHAHVARAAHALKSMSLSLGAVRVAALQANSKRRGGRIRRSFSLACAKSSRSISTSLCAIAKLQARNTA